MFDLILKGNESLLLDKIEQILLVNSGCLAIFAINLEDGEIKGSRRYLCTIDQGELLFGFSIDQSQSNCGLIAVALETSNLSALSDRDWESWLIQEQSQVLAKLQLWEKHLNAIINHYNPEGYFDFAATPEQIKTQLAALQEHFWQHLNELRQKEAQLQRSQFQSRQELNDRAINQALINLTSVIKPQTQPLCANKGDHFLIVAGAVGKAMGVTIYPPKSESKPDGNDTYANIARASHLRLRRVLLTDKWWQKDCGALLAYLEADRAPVALLPTPDAKYIIFNPQNQTRSLVNRENAEQLEPFAYTFYRPLPEQVVTAWEMLHFTMGGRGNDIITLLVTAAIATLLTMLTPQAVAILIDQVIPDANRSLLLQIGFALLAASFGAAIFQFSQAITTIRLQSLIEATAQAAIWDRLLNLKLTFFRQYAVGDLKSRVSAIIEIRNLLNTTVLKTLIASGFALLNFGLLLYYSPVLSIIAVSISLAVLIVTNISALMIRQQIRPLQELEGDIFGLTVQLIGGVSKLRVAGAESRAYAYWANKYSQMLKLTLVKAQWQDLLTIFNTSIPICSSILLFIVVITLKQQQILPNSHLSMGTFLAFNTAFGTFLAGLTNLSNTLINILDIKILWQRLKPILINQPEISLNKADPGQLMGNIRLEHIRFRYRPDGPLILYNITIEVKAGQFIAIVGASGSGKSTIIRLILGFDAPETGIVYYDGQDLSGLDITAVRRQLGVVLQQGRINTASILDNIAGGALISMDEAWESAKMAGFADDINAMPMGMHTVISEGGTNLSGGQRQRLLIARALVSKPKILIFDEATSALDNHTQAIVSQSLEQLQVTRIVVAHRLSTIRNADYIYVIDQGKVSQKGTFEQLSQESGLFANLMARQMV